jgi:hypothetical protein
MKIYAAFSVAMVVGVVWAPSSAHAQTCNSSGDCVSITQNGSGVALYATAVSNEAVLAIASGGIGVEGLSSSTYGGYFVSVRRTTPCRRGGCPGLC